MSRPHYVYILTNQSGCYYVGMTCDLRRRWHQHLHRRGAVMTRAYHVTRLVYAVLLPDKRSAWAHERSLKRRTRKRKLALIRKHNPGLKDLSVEFGWRKPLDSAGPRTASPPSSVARAAGSPRTSPPSSVARAAGSPWGATS